MEKFKEQLLVQKDEIAMCPIASYYSIKSLVTADKVRYLTVPSASLWADQKRLLKYIKNNFMLHAAAYGTQGKSYIDNGLQHKDALVIFKTDIKRFYPSTTYAKLKSTLEKHFSSEQLEWIEEYKHYLFYSSGEFSTKSYLPTGAPTSPYLANITLYGIDIQLTELASKYNATYTRYQDDITLSFLKEISLETQKLVETEIYKALTKDGWFLSEEKTKWLNPHHDQMVITGVDLRSMPKVNSSYVRNIVKPKIEQSIRHYFDRNRTDTIENTIPYYQLPRSMRRVELENIEFKHLIRIFFRELEPTLNYIKQVSPEQYEKVLKYFKGRFNRLAKHNDIRLDSWIVRIYHQLGYNFTTRGNLLQETLRFTEEQAIDEDVIYPDQDLPHDVICVAALKYYLQKRRKYYGF